MRIVFAIVLAGCAAEQAPVGYPADADPIPGEDSYGLTTRVQVPLGIAAVTSSIADLTAFSQHGGTTLLAETADTPAVQALNSLSSTLRTKLDGWIDIELDKQMIGTKTARQAVGDIATMATSVANDFTLESSLTISPTGAFHTLIDLNFHPALLDIVVPIGGITGDVLDQHPSAQVGAAGALSLGDQKFGLAFGSRAWQALGLATTTVYGGGVAIVQQLDCNAIAQSVAARCVSGVCVGHATDIASMCKAGLASLVTNVQAAFAPVMLKELRFVSGTAQLVDNHHSGVADEIDGTWQAELDDGTGVHTAQIAFTTRK